MKRNARFFSVSALMVCLLVAGCSQETQDVAKPPVADPADGLGKARPPKPPPSPANPAITYAVESRQGDKLMVMDSDGTHQALVFQGGRNSWLARPSWSPDGGSIAFLYSLELWRVDVVLGADGVPRGESPTLLFDDIAEGPEWSPGGELADTILFTRLARRDLEVIPAGGGDPYTLYTAPAEASGLVCPVWSADGSKIAFLEAGWSVSDWYTLKVLDAATRTVISSVHMPDLPAANSMTLDWARTDESRMAYGTGLPGEGMIYTIDLDWGPPPTYTITTITEGWMPGWWPDDGGLVYRTPKGNISLYDFDTGQANDLTAGSWPDWRR